MLELIIVLVIIAVLLSMAAPSLRGFYSAQRTANAAAAAMNICPGSGRKQANIPTMKARETEWRLR